MIQLSAMKRYFLLIYVPLVFLMMGSCKSPAAPDDIEIPQDVNLHFNVYNHTQGKIGEYTQAAKTGDTIIIKINEIGINQGQNMGVRSSLSISSVDANRIAIRGPLHDCQYLGFEADGDVSFVVNRDHSAWNFVYSIMLMNTGNGANYQLVDNDYNDGYSAKGLRFGPNMTYRRASDNVTAGTTIDETTITEAINDYNSAISFSWMTYGKIEKTENNESFIVYFDNIIETGAHHGNSGDGTWFVRVNPKLTRLQQIRNWSSEIAELTGTFDNLDDKSSFFTLNDWQTTGKISEIGKDLIAYIFAQDSKKIGLIM